MKIYVALCIGAIVLVFGFQNCAPSRSADTSTLDDENRALFGTEDYPMSISVLPAIGANVGDEVSVSLSVTNNSSRADTFSLKFFIEGQIANAQVQECGTLDINETCARDFKFKIPDGLQRVGNHSSLQLIAQSTLVETQSGAAGLMRLYNVIYTH